MPGFSEDDLPFRNRSFTAVKRVGELGFCKNDVQADEQEIIRNHIRHMCGTLRGELREDTFNLQLFLGCELTQLIVRLDSRHGLDKKRGAGGGDVMHQAGNGVFVFRLDGDDVAVLPHGDDRFLQDFGVGRRRNDFLQGLSCPGCGSAHFSADIGKLRRSAVGDLILPYDGGVNFLLQELIGTQGMEQVVNTRLADAVIREIAFDKARGAENAGNIQQLTAVERAAQFRPGQGGPDIPHTRKRRAAAYNHHSAGAAGLLYSDFHFRRFRRRLQRQALLFGRGADCLVRKHFQNGRQFQRFN